MTTAFSPDYAPVIDWSMSAAEVERCRAATARRAAAMASNCVHTRLAALGSIPGMGDKSIIERQRIGNLDMRRGV